MKKAVLVLMLAATVAGCSPTIGKWTDRGREGLTLQRASFTQWYTAAVKQVEADRQSLIRTVQVEIAMVMENGIPRANPQPDPNDPVETPAEWVKNEFAGLLLGLRGLDDKKAVLDEQYRRDMANCDAVSESLGYIDQLNRAYATDRDQLAAQVQKITVAVEQLSLQKGGAN